ncbi:hypothetical protein PLICRDRAFT_111173 [Plicaturopsis crispa FD-325 SS-3]|nr:hypothetical protein PLICRDRAFT_111173 [Plicaturopsis crispa FD-325 SS-3]
MVSCLRGRLPVQTATRATRVHRFYHSASSLNIEKLDKWIASPKHLVLPNTLSSEHLADLYITLPTRDGTRRPYAEPHPGDALPFGHHLVFFHPRHPEVQLRPDGTDADFCPPPPFTRRMWAGGKMVWGGANPLVVGRKATMSSDVAAVEKKGFESGSPMVFVKQRISIKMEGSEDASVEEERSHVYLPVSPGSAPRGIREVTGLPSPDFSFSFTPSLTTLFRFSALTWNGHHIHLDKDYAQQAEGYPERLVHGPLTALMLLETVLFHHPDAQLKSFEYRARNPLVVRRPLTVHGSFEDKDTVQLWVVDDKGTVGMTGKVCL